MSVKFRNNCEILGFSKDYYKIRNFLIDLNYCTYLFGRWDWMVTHGWLDASGLPKIGVWEENNEIVAMATYDCQLGESYFCVKKDYEYLKKEMLLYSKDSFKKDGNYLAVIADTDTCFQEIASNMGFIPTESKEYDAVYPINAEQIKYELPKGFCITSISETYDIFKYGQVLWKGFNHEANGEGAFNPSVDDLAKAEKDFVRPNVNLDIKIAVVAPNGDFVSYCGMWQDNATEFALVEPVATDPAYRKLGLGKAAVLEGIKRCGLLGAKKAFVGSSQQFYYSIGFRPYSTSTKWKIK